MASLIDPTGRPLKLSKDSAPARTAAEGAPPPGAPGGNTAANIKDATLASFAADVLDASMEVPVIVDFWAPWCGPCKQLGPALEKAVNEAKGAVRMVKIDIDKNQQLAAQMRIQSVPTVFAFKDGQPVDGFMGALPDNQVQAFVGGLV